MKRREEFERVQEAACSELLDGANEAMHLMMYISSNLAEVSDRKLQIMAEYLSYAAVGQHTRPGDKLKHDIVECLYDVLENEMERRKKT